MSIVQPFTSVQVSHELSPRFSSPSMSAWSCSSFSSTCPYSSSKTIMCPSSRPSSLSFQCPVTSFPSFITSIFSIFCYSTPSMIALRLFIVIPSLTLMTLSFLWLIIFRVILFPIICYLILSSHFSSIYCLLYMGGPIELIPSLLLSLFQLYSSSPLFIVFPYT